MATFAKATFNVAHYSSFRPTYPKQLFDTIYKYHSESPTAEWSTVLDLGCGTGQATSVLAERFRNAIGVDPSSAMIDKATAQNKMANVKYIASAAEELPDIKDNSIDLVTAGQAVHWFDYERLWKELSRVVKRGGSVAFWGYSQPRFTHYPELTEHIHDYSIGSQDKLGPHWEQPGRSILDNHLQAVPLPSAPPWDPSSRSRVYFVGAHHPDLPDRKEVILRKTLTWEGVEAYWRTWSSLHSYQEKHPEDKTAVGGDIVTRFLDHAKAVVKSSRAQRNADENPELIDVEWPLALLIVRKTV